MLDWQPLAVGMVVVIAALFLLKRSMTKKSCGHGCGCGQTAQKVRDPEHWVGDLQVRPKEPS